MYDGLRDALEKAVAGVRTGDPGDSATHVGPMIDEAAARRVEEWVGEAEAAGATVVVGGAREGTT